MNIKILTSFLRAPHSKTAAISPQISELPMHCLIKWLDPPLIRVIKLCITNKTHPEFQFCRLSYRKDLNKDFVLHFKGLICILNHLVLSNLHVVKDPPLPRQHFLSNHNNPTFCHVIIRIKVDRSLSYAYFRTSNGMTLLALVWFIKHIINMLSELAQCWKGRQSLLENMEWISNKIYKSSRCHSFIQVNWRSLGGEGGSNFNNMIITWSTDSTIH